MDQELLKKIITRVLARITGFSLLRIHPQPIPVGVSNRHLHLSSADLEALFGAGYQLQKGRDLLQPRQFAAMETVSIAGPKGCIEKVRVLGPIRERTQVEVSRTDGYRLGLNPPLRESGKLQGSCPVTLIGPLGSVYLQEGLIIAQRHLHMSPADAVCYGVADGDNIQIRIGGERNLVFDRVKVRVSPDYHLEFHLDTDEANAAGISQGDLVNLLTDDLQSSVINKSAPERAEKSPETVLSLITEETVRMAWENKTTLLATKSTIFTPLARDTMKELGVEVIWGDRDE